MPVVGAVALVAAEHGERGIERLATIDHRRLPAGSDRVPAKEPGIHGHPRLHREPLVRRSLQQGKRCKVAKVLREYRLGERASRGFHAGEAITPGAPRPSTRRDSFGLVDLLIIPRLDKQRECGCLLSREREMRGNAGAGNAPFAVATRGQTGLVGQVGVLVTKVEEASTAVACNVRLLLSLAPLGFLNVREIGVERPTDIDADSSLRAIGQLERHAKLGDTELVTHSQVERAVGNAMLVGLDRVARLAATAATERAHLGMDIVEVEHRGILDCGLSEPWRLTVQR